MCKGSETSVSVKLLFWKGIFLGSQRLLRIRKRNVQSRPHTHSSKHAHSRSWFKYEAHCGHCVWKPSFHRSYRGWGGELWSKYDDNYILSTIATNWTTNLCIIQVYAWGQNNCGQVGNSITTNQGAPRHVNSNLAGKKVVHISCGQTSSMVITDSGEVYGWGYNGVGQLGIGNYVNQMSPSRVGSLIGVVISDYPFILSVYSLRRKQSMLIWFQSRWSADTRTRWRSRTRGCSTSGAGIVTVN